MHAGGGFAPALGNVDKAAGSANASMRSRTFDNGATSGTITLDVVQAQAPDGSAVFKVVETGFNAGKPFMCAAYGQTGNVVCNADAPLRPDTLILLRVAGNGFYARSRLDTNKHWRTESPGSNLSEVSDFTVTKTDGALITISMKRRGAQQQPPMDSSIDGTIVYDTAAQIPRSIDVTMTLQQRGAGTAPESSRIDVELQP
jgi:hypothetical protein